MTWSIIAMSGSDNVALSGTGNINTTTVGSIRVKTSQCYAAIDGSLKLCSSFLPGDEEVLYTYDEDVSVADFLLYKKDPYFILYNANAPTSVPVQVDISSSKPFSFPTVSLTAKSNKAESSEVYQFVENKAKYYDALKY